MVPKPMMSAGSSMARSTQVLIKFMRCSIAGSWPTSKAQVTVAHPPDFFSEVPASQEPRKRRSTEGAMALTLAPHSPAAEICVRASLAAGLCFCVSMRRRLLH